MTLDDIVLSDDLEWTDRLSWSPIEQTTEYSVTGALLMQESEKQSGRPITLQGSDDMAWLTRTTLDLLQAKKIQIGLTMTLTINGTDHTVKWLQSSGAIDVTPIRRGGLLEFLLQG